MFLDQHPCKSWYSIPINQSDLRDIFSSLGLQPGFYTIFIHPSVSSDSKDELGIGLGPCFWTGM